MNLKLALVLLSILLASCDQNSKTNFLLPSGSVYYNDLSIRSDKLWYKKNSKKPFSGDFYEVSGDQKWSEGSISQGMMTRWVKYHLNGNKKSVQVWQGGKHEGVQKKWHSNGNKFIEMEYKNGQKLSSNFWDRKGKKVNSIKEAKH